MTNSIMHRKHLLGIDLILEKYFSNGLMLLYFAQFCSLFFFFFMQYTFDSSFPRSIPRRCLRWKTFWSKLVPCLRHVSSHWQPIIIQHVCRCQLHSQYEITAISFINTLSIPSIWFNCWISALWNWELYTLNHGCDQQ